MIDLSLIFHVLIAFGAFQALFISFILLSQNKTSLPEKFFAFVLAIEGITLIERLLVMTDLIVSVPHLLGVSYPLSFIKAPMLFFMAIAIANRKFRLRKIHLLHLLPFFAILLVNIPFYFQNAYNKLDFVRAFMEYVPTYQSFDFYLSLSFFTHIGIYILATILILNRYKTQVKNNKLANWYLQVLWFYSVTLIISLIYFILLPSGLLEIEHFHVVSMLIMTFLIQSIAYGFFTRSSIFQNKNVTVIDNTEQLRKDEKLIRDKLECDKAYVDDTLNLGDFAKSIGLPKKYVSDLIN